MIVVVFAPWHDVIFMVGLYVGRMRFGLVCHDIVAQSVGCPLGNMIEPIPEM